MLVIFSAMKNEKLGNCTPALKFFQGAKTTDLFGIISYQYFYLCTFNFEGMGCLTGAARIAGAETLEAAYLTRPRQQLQRPSTSPWCGVAHDAGNIYLFLADSLPVFQLCNHKKNSKSETQTQTTPLSGFWSYWVLCFIKEKGHGLSQTDQLSSKDQQPHDTGMSAAWTQITTRRSQLGECPIIKQETL